MRHVTGALVVFAACNAHPLAEVEMERSRQWVAASACIEDPAKVDVLLVIDNSPSMSDEAQALADNLRDFAMLYEQEGSSLDYRIAVVTTDASSPDCASGRGDGDLQLRACTEHLEDFVTAGSPESPDADNREICTEACGWNELPTLPTAVAGDELLRPRPWLQRERGEKNIPEKIPMPDALACAGQVGLGGCEAEAPIAAAARALRRARDPADPNYGFLRDDAGLSIIFIGDEDDCSRPDGAEESLAEPGTSASASCWAEVADCESTPQGLWCNARSSPRLSDLDGFLEQLYDIEEAKQRVIGLEEQRVFVSAVAGVPLGFPDSPQVFGAGDDSDFDEAFGSDPGCAQGDRIAAPTVRLRDVADAFSPWNTNLVSSCGDSWVGALACLPNQWPRARDSIVCLDVAQMQDPNPAMLAASCMLTETLEGERVRVPNCEPACEDVACEAGPTAWRIPDGAEACVFWEAFGAQAYCSDRDMAEARVLRREDRKQGWCYEVTCAETL